MGFGLQIGDAATPANAGIRDDDVEATEPRNCLLDESHDCRLVGDVSRNDVGRATGVADRLGNGLESPFPPGSEDDGCAGFS